MRFWIGRPLTPDLFAILYVTQDLLIEHVPAPVHFPPLEIFFRARREHHPSRMIFSPASAKRGSMISCRERRSCLAAFFRCRPRRALGKLYVTKFLIVVRGTPLVRRGNRPVRRLVYSESTAAEPSRKNGRFSGKNPRRTVFCFPPVLFSLSHWGSGTSILRF